MPLRKHPADAPGADNPRTGVVSAPRPTSVIEADELAQAEARAEAARARALRLRQQADAASNDQASLADVEDTDGQRDVSATVGEGAAESAPSRRRRLHRPSRRALTVAAAVVVMCGALTASGYLAWQHSNVAQERQRAVEFSTAARNAVVAMMSIDPNSARDDIERFADETTGLFKVGVLMGAQDLVEAVEQSKMSSKCTVQASAVQSVTKDSAVVLVAAKSEVTKPDQAKPESRSMRVVVSLEREGGQLKISRIEFAP